MFLVECVERPGRLRLVRRHFPKRRCRRRGLTRWRGSAHAAVVGILRLLIVEVVRWAIACHGTDGTDTAFRPAQNVVTLSTLTNAPGCLPNEVVPVAR